MTNETILSYSYKDVPIYWRRLLMDTSLLKVICLLEKEEENRKVYKQLIEILDTALIVSGGPGEHRRSMALDLINDLHILSRSSLDNKKYNNNNRNNGLLFTLDTTTPLPLIQYPITILSTPPDYHWFETYINVASASPLHLKGELMHHWPALTTRPWSRIDYILDKTGDRLVPVEIGSQYTDTHWQQKMMTMEDFILNYILKDEKEEKEIAYLAQHDLFYQIPLLENDISIPDYCFICPQPTIYYTPKKEQLDDDNDDHHPIIKNAWFGPKGTVSPLHHDPYHNLLAQVVGRKYIRLYAPTDSDALYPYDGIMSNTSQIDIDDPDLVQFPLFKNVNYIECILNPGEMLYIPPKWWHYVRSLDASFSVSFWF
ncbi:hypothetical protein BJ944DRAFT_159446 [Cunninghamella echinulata]|nr:hypothetical protein BJ944DRAFT_159446 [Cunninghamella echinulata]